MNYNDGATCNEHLFDCSWLMIGRSLSCILLSALQIIGSNNHSWSVPCWNMFLVGPQDIIPALFASHLTGHSSICCFLWNFPASIIGICQAQTLDLLPSVSAVSSLLTSFTLLTVIPGWLKHGPFPWHLVSHSQLPTWHHHLAIYPQTLH